MIVAALGMIALYKKLRSIFYATLVSVILTAYLFSSWWAWSYGICWGMRPMIDSYSFMSFPLAAAFSFILDRKKITSIILMCIVSLLIVLNLFQTWQYKNGLIHFDDMTREAFFKGFFQIEKSEEWSNSLKPFDWERRRKGLNPIAYSKSYFEKINSNEQVYLQGANLSYLSASVQSDFIITCNFNEVGNEELFQLIRINGDTVALKAGNNKFLAVSSQLKGMLTADAGSVTDCEKFVMTLIEADNNKVAFKACNNKYLALTQRAPNIIGALATDITEASTFKLFVYEKP